MKKTLVYGLAVGAMVFFAAGAPAQNPCEEEDYATYGITDYIPPVNPETAQKEDSIKKLKDWENKLQKEFGEKKNVLAKKERFPGDTLVFYSKKLAQLQKDVEEARTAELRACIKLLTIPYEEFTIEEIAVKDFQKAAGDQLVASPDLQAKLNLLKNYKQDTASLKALLSGYIKELKKLAPETNAAEWAAAKEQQLKETPLYTSYTSALPNDWRSTWIGSALLSTSRIFSEASKSGETLDLKNLLTQKLEQNLNSLK